MGKDLDHVLQLLAIKYKDNRVICHSHHIRQLQFASPFVNFSRVVRQPSLPAPALTLRLHFSNGIVEGAVNACAHDAGITLSLVLVPTPRTDQGTRAVRTPENL